MAEEIETGVSDPENIEIDSPPPTDPSQGDPEGRDVQAGLLSEQAPSQPVDLAGNPLPAGRPVTGSASVSASSKKYRGAPSSVQVDPWALNPEMPLQAGAAQMGAVDRATEAAKEAAKQQAEVTSAYEAKNAEILQRQQELERHWAGVDERTSAAAAAEAHKYVAAYQEQIAAVRQMTVDPSGPIGKLSSGQFAGMELANFAQGFLAARYGIHINVSEQIDHWVDRSIQEQQRRIQQAQAGAEDQLHLWDIARQTSRDDQEAKQRYRGMIIAGVQTSLQANAAQYKSDLANSQAAASNAALDMEAVKSKQAIWNNTYNQVKQNEVLKETHWFHVQQLSLDEEKIALRAQLAANKNATTSALTPIDDPEHPGAPKWGVDPKDKQAVKEAREARAAAGVLMTRLDELQNSYEKAYGKWGGKSHYLFSDALASPEVREYHRAQKAAALAMVDYGRARRYTETHVKNIMDLMPDEKGWQRGTNADAIDTIKENIRGDFENAMNTYSNERFHGQTAMPKHASEHKTRMAVGEGEPTAETPIGNEERVAEQGGGAPVKATPQWERLMGSIPQTEASRGVDALVVALMDPDRFNDLATKGGFGHTVLKDRRIHLDQAEKSLRRVAATSRDVYSRVYATKLLHILDEGGLDALNATLAPVTVTAEDPNVEMDQPEK